MATNVTFAPQGTHGAQQDQAGQRTVAQVLGEILWLFTQSPVHRSLFVSDFEWAVMPAVLHEQFRLYYAQGRPGGLVLWAYVSPETEERLSAIGGARLRPDEWKAGDRPWVIEMVAPFGGQDEMLADVAAVVFEGKPFKYLRTGPAGAEVVTHAASAH